VYTFQSQETFPAFQVQKFYLLFFFFGGGGGGWEQSKSIKYFEEYITNLESSRGAMHAKERERERERVLQRKVVLWRR
jgi:hypothetical protein